jgi:hypothetical protein
MNNDLAFNSVDTLGQLLAQIADLTKQADAIKDQIKDGGKTVEGVPFKATYVEANRKSVDTKKCTPTLVLPMMLLPSTPTQLPFFLSKSPHVN